LKFSQSLARNWRLLPGRRGSALPPFRLCWEGDNKPGLGYNIAQMIAEGGINLAFFVAQVIGRKFAAVIGFETEDDAKKAAPLIKKAAKCTGA